MLDKKYNVDCKNCKSDFLCCKDETMPVDVTLGDVFRISDSLRLDVFDFFRKFIVIKPIGVNVIKPILSSGIYTGYKLRACLDSPCKFFKEGLCEIQNFKPITCLSFPGKVINEVPNDSLISSYTCIKNNQRVFFPYINDLKKIYEREGGNLICKLFEGEIHGNDYLDLESLQKKEKEINESNRPHIEKEELFVLEVRKVITPKVNSEKIKVIRVIDPELPHECDEEIIVNLREEITTILQKNLTDLREGIRETTKEYFRIRNEYSI